MIQVGITGGIGSGKSTVAEVFKILGVPVYHADDRAKELYQLTKVKQKVIESFGANAYNGNELNREFMAAQVFGDKSKLQAINSIIHPAVAEDYKGWLKSHSDKLYVLKEAAILYLIAGL